MRTPNNWTIPQLEALNRAQTGKAKLYRKWERVSPWNTKTRQGWRDLAQISERLARHARAAIAIAKAKGEPTPNS